MDACKHQYDSIPIPDQLDQAVSRGFHRGLLRRISRQTAAGLAAVLALTLTVANVPPLAAAAAQVPVLNQLVRIMRVGSGGSASADVHMEIRAENGSICLDFDAPVPSYSVVRRSGPERLILRIHGLETPDPQQAAEALASHPALEQVYPVACTESDTLGLVLMPVSGKNAALSQYETHLQLDFAQGEPAPQTPSYHLVSDPMDFGPELAQLTEALLWEGATQLRRADGRYQVVLGTYPTLERAKLAQTGIQNHTGVLLTPELIP